MYYIPYLENIGSSGCHCHYKNMLYGPYSRVRVVWLTLKLEGQSACGGESSAMQRPAGFRVRCMFLVRSANIFVCARSSHCVVLAQHPGYLGGVKKDLLMITHQGPEKKSGSTNLRAQQVRQSPENSRAVLHPGFDALCACACFLSAVRAQVPIN